MEWRYYGITLTGLKKSGTHTLERHLERIRQIIRDRRWTQQLPAVRTGTLFGTTYVFLAHVEEPEDPPTQVPEAISQVCLELQYIKEPMRPSGRYGGYTLGEIQGITRGTLSTDSIGSLDGLFRDLVQIEVPIPALDLSASPEESLDTADPKLERRHELLLAYLSCCGEGSWDRFARAATALRLARPDQPLRLRSLIRRLILLGHVQTSANQERWSVCPLRLVTRDDEPEGLFLCGPRTPGVLAELERLFGAAEAIHQPLYDGPPCVVFRADPEKIAGVTLVGGVPASHAGAFARRLAEALPHYEGWLASLPTDGSLRMAAFPDCRRFDGAGFVPSACPYAEGDRVVGQAGLYEFAPPEGPAVVRYLGHSGTWRAGDFYGLRYAGTVAAVGHTNVQRLQAGQVAVPAAMRWPLLHERCLVLASGRLPDRLGDGQWLRYTGVSRELLDSLRGKLPFDLKETDDA
jgi:hypothetical protein